MSDGKITNKPQFHQTFQVPEIEESSPTKAGRVDTSAYVREVSHPTAVRTAGCKVQETLPF